MATTKKTGTSKTDTRDTSRSATADGEGNQITHLNKKIVKEWMSQISPEDAKEVADYANERYEARNV